MFVVFLILRRTLRRQYEPRTFLSSLRPQERTPALSRGLTSWFGEFSKIPDSWVLNHESMDGYLLLRFLKISTVICLVGCLIIWPVLFPVNATGGGGQQQLDILHFANIRTPQNSSRLYAHTFIGWIFFGMKPLETRLHNEKLKPFRLCLVHDCSGDDLLHQCPSGLPPFTLVLESTICQDGLVLFGSGRVLERCHDSSSVWR